MEYSFPHFDKCEHGDPGWDVHFGRTGNQAIRFEREAETERIRQKGARRSPHSPLCNS